MMQDGIWERFGQPDHAMAFHVASSIPTGKLSAVIGSPYSGADTVDIIVHGIGAHGASPHTGVDPVLLGSQIVVALQSVVSRTLPPLEAGVITVGAFNAGSKHNIISDRAHLQLTVRNDNPEAREILLDGIRRVAVNMGRVAGLPDELLPEVIVSEESVPPTMNDPDMTQRLRGVWGEHFGGEVFFEDKRLGMGAEDFPYFTTDPYIPSTYFAVGGTPPEAFERERAGGEQHRPPPGTGRSRAVAVLCIATEHGAEQALARDELVVRDRRDVQADQPEQDIERLVVNGAESVGDLAARSMVERTVKQDAVAVEQSAAGLGKEQCPEGER
jgi:metal-dependent amidase/aminoacylase/carboxypeptidase family protein